MGAKNGRTKRERQGRAPRARRATRTVPDDADTLALVLAAHEALDAGAAHDLDDRVLDLVVRGQQDERAAGADDPVRLLDARLQEAVADRWRQGWAPGDLRAVVGQARRHPGADGRALARVTHLLDDAVAADLSRHDDGSVDPTWSPQPAVARARARGLRTRADEWGAAAALEAALRLDHLLRRLDPLQPLGPLPGEATSADLPDVDERVLEKVRRLLAKAESTPYEAEAETFTAGAQALMARHSIERAHLGRGTGEQPRGRRVWLGAYPREEVLLLAAVAEANRSQTVWSRQDGHVTVLGFVADVDATETLFTSLLVQATRAMHAEGRRAEATRDFRASFLAAFATRIGERLAAVVHEESDAAERTTPGTGLVLREREAEVQRWSERLFGELRPVTVTLPGDPEGWSKGRRAADAASLGGGPAVER